MSLRGITCREAQLCKTRAGLLLRAITRHPRAGFALSVGEVVFGIIYFGASSFSFFLSLRILAAGFIIIDRFGARIARGSAPREGARWNFFAGACPRYARRLMGLFREFIREPMEFCGISRCGAFGQLGQF